MKLAVQRICTVKASIDSSFSELSNTVGFRELLLDVLDLLEAHVAAWT